MKALPNPLKLIATATVSAAVLAGCGGDSTPTTDTISAASGVIGVPN